MAPEELNSTEIRDPGGSMLRRAFDHGAYILGPMPEDDPLVPWLGYRPRNAVLMPISISGKVVSVLYGDCGEEFISPTALSELHIVAPYFGKRLKRLFVMKRKELLTSLEEKKTNGGTLRSEEETHLAATQTERLVPSGTTRGLMAADESRPNQEATPDGELESEETHATVSELLEASGNSADDNIEHKTDEIRVQMSTISGLPADAADSQESSHTESQDAIHQILESPGKHGTFEDLRYTAEHWVQIKTPEEDVLLMKSEIDPSEKRKALLQFCSLGLSAMPAMTRYFPGIVNVHPFATEYQRIDVTEYSDALFCLSRLGADLAAPILLSEVDHEDRVHRYSAIWGLSELHVPAALPLLFQRVFDPELRIGYLAIDVLESHRAEPGFAETMAALRRILTSENTLHQKRAILAVTQFRDRNSILALIDLLGAAHTEIVEISLAALIEITKNDFGRSKRKWKSWLEQYGEEQRLDWLVAGLSHKSTHVRKSAQLELNTRTGEYLDFQFDASRSARAAGVSRWREWWTRHKEEPKWSE